MKTVRCRKCGSEITFARTRRGSWMPCEPEPVYWEPDADGQDFVIDAAGEVRRVRIVTDGEYLAYVPHWTKCKRNRLEQRREEAREELEYDTGEEPEEVGGCGEVLHRRYIDDVGNVCVASYYIGYRRVEFIKFDTMRGEKRMGQRIFKRERDAAAMWEELGGEVVDGVEQILDCSIAVGM